MTSALPVISLSSETLGSDIRKACETSGFFYLSDHGMPQAEIDFTFDCSRTLFLDTSDEAMKEKYESQNRQENTGYTALAHEKLDPTSPNATGDLKESFYLKRFRNGASPQKLPQCLASETEHLSAFFERCRSTCLQVLEGFAAALDLGQGYFAQHHSSTLDRLRLIHYPPAPLQTEAQDGQIRAGSHSDYGSCTLLFQKDVGGLQVQTGKQWIDVPPKEGCLVCNVGDAMEFWTGGRFKSTNHRVAMPMEEGQTQSRFSMAYFCQPDEDCLLAPIPTLKKAGDFFEVAKRKGIKDPSQHLTGGQHLRARLAATY